jgi:hypothetical protein
MGYAGKWVFGNDGLTWKGVYRTWGRRLTHMDILILLKSFFAYRFSQQKRYLKHPGEKNTNNRGM